VVYVRCPNCLYWSSLPGFGQAARKAFSYSAQLALFEEFPTTFFDLFAQTFGNFWLSFVAFSSVHLFPSQTLQKS